jgi:hypothetical protein
MCVCVCVCPCRMCIFSSVSPRVRACTEMFQPIPDVTHACNAVVWQRHLITSATGRGVPTCRCWGWVSRPLLLVLVPLRALGELLLKRDQPSRSLQEAVYLGHTLCTGILIAVYAERRTMQSGFPPWRFQVVIFNFILCRKKMVENCMSTVMNLEFHEGWEVPWRAERLWASQEGVGTWSGIVSLLRTVCFVTWKLCRNLCGALSLFCVCVSKRS